jgi:hypothetical protein
MFSPLDILYIVLAFCVLWFTAALFWLLWQVAMIFRNINKAVSDLREKLMKIEEAISFIRGKFDHASSMLTMLVAGVGKVVDYAMERRREAVEPKMGKGKSKKIAKSSEEE